jgi:ABC-type sulfate transport system permease component
MFPPTPTPLPDVPLAPVVIDAARWRIWEYTDEAIMIWQQMQERNMGTVIQIAVLLVMVIFFVVYLTRLAQSLTNEGAL